MSLFELEGLTKRFGGLTAVDGLSFGVERGEIVGLIGPNGSGKTTVFNCTMGRYPVTDGSIYFGGAEITDDDTHEVVDRGLARVSQESNPIEAMSVAANIKLFTLPNSVRTMHGGGDEETIVGYAARLGLEDDLDELPGSLPHADVRRLEIAKALATEPEMLLIDEPFAGMNQQEIDELIGTFETFREEGLTMIVVDHNMGGLMRLVDRVVVIHNGTKIAEGAPETVAADDAVRDAYLGSSEVM